MPARRRPSAAEHAAAQRSFQEAVRRHLQQDFPAAADAYRKALELDPDIAEAHNNLGALLAERGEREDARASLQRAVELQPDYGEALRNLGLLSRDQRRHEEAVGWLERAVACEAERAEWWNDLGNALLESFQFERALEAYDRAVALQPDQVEALTNRASALRGLDRMGEAVQACLGALELRPDFLVARSNLGLLYKDLRRLDDARDTLLEALRRAPESAAVMVNLAVVYLELDEVGKAIELADRAIATDPGFVDAHNVRGNCALEEGDLDTGLRCHRRAEELNPLDANANWNLSLFHLLRGDLRAGWERFDWRRRLTAVRFDRRCEDAPEWDGTPLEGRRILVHTEQGLGDSLQFIRYAELLQRAGAGRVLVECPENLAGLFSRVAGVDQVVVRGEPLPPFDVHAYLMSLPALLGTELDTIPARVPYLPVEERPVASRVAEEDGVLKVGLVWAGGQLHQRDRIRSMQLRALSPLLRVPGVRFYSLQKGPPEAQLQEFQQDGIVALGPELEALEDTASVISRLDLVISVDTAMAHLAGALGCPTWVALPSNPDWRWMLGREDTPWYPTMRLFRQPTRGDWTAVVARMAEELRRLAGAELAEDFTELPSATRGPGGRPRYHLTIPISRLAEPAVWAAYEAELVGAGAERGVREALDELLRPGDICLDISPALGLTTLSMATAPAGRVPVLALERDPDRAAWLRGQVERNRLGETVGILSAGPDALPPLDSLTDNRTFIRLGEPEAAPELLRAANGLLRRGALAGIAWGGEGQVPDAALRTLADAGFRHFDVTWSGDEAVLDELLEGGGARPSLSLVDSVLAEWSPPNAAPATTRRSHPEAGPATSLLGIDWPVGAPTGWGTYGLNLALQLAAHQEVQPVLIGGVAAGNLAPLHRALLAPTLAESARVAASIGSGRVDLDFPLLRAFGNGFFGAPASVALRSKRSVGVVFFEDTHLTPEALDRARALDRIIAGSTWNAEVLRAHGLDHVRVCLQGIDPTLFHPAPPSGLFTDRFVIFSGGKLEYRKGQDIVVAAFREFHRRHSDALLLFAWHNAWPSNMGEITFGGHVEGTPGMLPGDAIDFSGWLLRNGLPEGSFVDLGQLTAPEMARALREAHAAAFPNRCEGGTNLVAMECMAAGIPTILSANTGHLDLISPEQCFPLHQQGRVAPSRDCAGVDGWGESSVEELLESLERIYSDRQEAARRAAGAAAAMRQLSWASQTERLLGEIVDLL